MRFQHLIGAAITAASLVLGTQGCGRDPGIDDEGVHCEPSAYVLCTCADKSHGTKQCKSDGASFEKCTTKESGECVGGEDLTANDTGKPADPPPKADPFAGVDACPGKATAVGATAVVIEDDTTGARDKAKGRAGACAAGAGGADHIYHLQATVTGSMSVKVQGLGAMNPTVYLRSGCEGEETQLACAESTGAGGAEQFQYNVVTGRSYYLYVDGASGSAGKYALTLKVTGGPVCGDGKIDLNEACDDGNKIDGDGCSPSCTAVDGDPASGGSCPGQPVHVWPGKYVSGTGSTETYGNTFKNTTAQCSISGSVPPPNTASDHLYEVTAHGAGKLKVTLTPVGTTYNAMLVARKTCLDALSQGVGMCSNASNPGSGPETMTFPVTKDQTVYVAADGSVSEKGKYSIKFELLP